ncbi:hypothetical protein HYX19_01280 [Candidatus Woesearchaeota archaeon]|nr:hypothetical protein [Candidatus Woesearchaeota archaeon]
MVKKKNNNITGYVLKKFKDPRTLSEESIWDILTDYLGNKGTRVVQTLEFDDTGGDREIFHYKRSTIDCSVDFESRETSVKVYSPSKRNSKSVLADVIRKSGAKREPRILRELFKVYSKFV